MYACGDQRLTLCVTLKLFLMDQELDKFLDRQTDEKESWLGNKDSILSRWLASFYQVILWSSFLNLRTFRYSTLKLKLHWQVGLWESSPCVSVALYLTLLLSLSGVGLPCPTSGKKRHGGRVHYFLNISAIGRLSITYKYFK